MNGRGRTILTAGAMIALVLVASYLMYGDAEDGDSIGVGDTMTYLVFGSFDTGETIEGTSAWTLVGETEDQCRYEMEQHVYAVGPLGFRTVLSDGTWTEWVDKTSGDGDWTDAGTVTVDTFWGERTLSAYATEDGSTRILVRGDAMYAFMYEGDGYTLYMELDGCTAFSEDKVDRPIHTATVSMGMRGESGGVPIAGGILIEVDNGETEIFKRAETTMTAYIEGHPEYGYLADTAWTSWYDPFDGTGADLVGTESLDTPWGRMEVDVCRTSDGGRETTLYVYDGRIPMRMVVEQDGTTMQFDTDCLTLDGEDVRPEELRFI